MHRGRRVPNAFTLIELLVVIAIVGLLMSLLLPAVGRSRRIAQVAKSLANLHSNTGLILLYASDNKDCFVNPFERFTTCSSNPNAFLDWSWAPTDFCNLGFPYGEGFASNSGTETYGYFWGAHLLYSQDESLTRSSTLISPGDKALGHWFQDNIIAHNDWTGVFPSSYWYPPVFWQNPARFDPGARMVSDSANHYWISRNRVSQTVFANGKVLLFENKDYYNKNETMWNDGASYTNVGMVDASARSVRMADVIARTSTNGGQQQDHIEAPSGVWNPGNGEMNLYLYGVNSGFDWGDLTQPRAAFFWATRHGLRGLDLP